MAPHGYIPLVKQILSQHPAPSLLEVGTDTGVMLVSAVLELIRHKKPFAVVSCDIKQQEHVKAIVRNLEIDRKAGQMVTLVEGSSLELLPSLADNGVKFDVVVIDGDHNYYTVSRELECLDKLASDVCVCIVDDYYGKWSETDLWYAERPGYEGVVFATKRVETEKHGVKPAVDEFVAAHPEWELSKLLEGEPVLLCKGVSVGLATQKS